MALNRSLLRLRRCGRNSEYRDRTRALRRRHPPSLSALPARRGRAADRARSFAGDGSQLFAAGGRAPGRRSVRLDLRLPRPRRFRQAGRALYGAVVRGRPRRSHAACRLAVCGRCRCIDGRLRVARLRRRFSAAHKCAGPDRYHGLVRRRCAGAMGQARRAGVDRRAAGPHRVPGHALVRRCVPGAASRSGAALHRCISRQ